MLDSTVWLDLATGNCVSRIDQMAGGYAVSPDLRRLVLVGADEWTGIAPIQWTDLSADAQWRAFPLPSETEVSGVAFDESGTRFAVSGERRLRRRGAEVWQHTIHVFQFEQAIPLATLTVTDAATVIAFNRDATRIAVAAGLGGNSTTVEAYLLQSGELLTRFEPPGTVTRCVAFAPADRLAVANGRSVYILAPGTSEPQFTLTGHTGQVNAVAFTRDGRKLLTASHDGAIRVWDPATGRTIKAFDWKIGSITAIAFAPDGLTCAAAGKSGQVVVWDMDE
jgi:WD40 repeat protein